MDELRPDEPDRHARVAAQERGDELVDRHADGPPNMPSATVPPRSSVSSPTLPAASSTARRLRAACSAKARPASVGDHPAAGAHEQVGAERVLELADLLGDGRLRDAQRLGRGRERAELERRAEAADLLQRQKLSFGLRQADKPTFPRRPAPMMRA